MGLLSIFRRKKAVLAPPTRPEDAATYDYVLQNAQGFALGFEAEKARKPTAKLTETDVKHIKRALAADSETPRTKLDAELAGAYGVSPSTVRNIRLERTWKEVSV